MGWGVLILLVMKRLSVLILFVIIIISNEIYPYSFAKNGIYYTITGNNEVAVSYNTTSYNSYSGQVVIPSIVSNSGINYNVTKIGGSAFRSCNSVTSLSLPNSINYIEGYAFKDFTSPITLSLSENITYYGPSSFNNCTAEATIIMASSITKLNGSTFLNFKGLKNITLPDNLTTISSYDFQGCTNLTSISIPDETTSIDPFAFIDCSALILVGSQNPNYSSMNGILYNKDFTILQHSPTSLVGELIILPSVNLIQTYAFYNCNKFTALTISNSVTTIGSGSFYGCSSLESIVIGENVITISDNSFNGCTNLQTVYYNAKNCKTSTGLGSAGKFQTLIFGDKVESIPKNAFYNCSKISNTLIFPLMLNSIGEYAFYGCSGLTGILTIPTGIIEISPYTFYNCSKLTSVNFPNTLNSIGNYAFYNCYGLSKLELPNSLTSVGGHAFHFCWGIKGSLNLDASLLSIGDFAFGICSGIDGALIIPSSLISIGLGAFYDCKNISSIYSFVESPMDLTTNEFYNVSKSNCKLHIPIGKGTIYRNIAGWNEFSNIVEIKTQFTDYFRTTSSGSNINNQIWESSEDGLFWINATLVPNNQSTNINVQSNHLISIDENCEYENLKINSNGKITINPNVSVTVNKLDNVGEVVLSDNSSFIPSGEVTGNGAFKVEKTLTGSNDQTDRQWWYVSSPVSDATSAVFNPAGSNNMGYYNEAGSPPDYVPMLTNDLPLEVGRGYLLQNKTSGKYTFTGTSFNNGDITITPTRTGTTQGNRGFNLIGNPYPSYLNWKLAYESPSTFNIRPTIWYRTTTGVANYMKFKTYNAATEEGLEGVTEIIPPMQGFWCKVDQDGSDGSITFTNSMRLHAGASLNLMKTPGYSNSTSIEKQKVRLQLSNGTITDELLLVGMNNASTGIDVYDSEKISNNNSEIPELYSFINNQELAINSTPNLTDKIFKLGYRPGKSGVFTIKLTESTNLDPNLKIVLIDNSTLEETILDLEQDYKFTSDGTVENNRFFVQFKTAGTITEMNHSFKNKMYVWVDTDNQIHYETENNIKAEDIRVFDVYGRLISMINKSSNVLSFENSAVPGVFIVKLGNQTEKITIR